MPKTYNTPKRSHIVKTRLDDEEYSEFMRRMELYGMNQSEFLRQAITGAPVRPIITVHPVNDDCFCDAAPASVGIRRKSESQPQAA